MLDLTSTLGGAYCGRLLAAGGLDVTRAEPPGGHWLRRWSASGAAIADGESGALFQWLAGGQRSVTVDPDDAADGAELLAEWASTMDAVLWSPGAAGRRSSTGARCGPPPRTPSSPPSRRSGSPDRGPTARHRAHAAGAVGRPGAAGVAGVAADDGGRSARRVDGRRVRRRGHDDRPAPSGAVGRGRRHRPLVPRSRDHDAAVQPDHAGDDGRRACGRGAPRRRWATWWRRRTATSGFAVVNRLQHWHDFCAMIGHQEWADDRSLDVVWNRSERSDELNPRSGPGRRPARRPRSWSWPPLLRIPAIEVGNGATIPLMDHFAAEGFYDVNPAGGLPAAGGPVPLPPAAARHARRGAGPGTGPAHPHRNSAAGARARPRPVAPSVRAAHGAGRPFDGLRIADFTSFWAGPFLTHTHGDVRRRRDPRRVRRAPRRRPADEPLAAGRAPVVGALVVLPRHQHQQARRHPRHGDRPGPGPGPPSWWPSATSSSRTTARG